VKTTNILVGVAYDNARESETKFIHKHEFVRAKDEDANKFWVQNITCRKYYRDLCGKTLKNINRSLANEKI
jgi:hypothetical protein